MAMVNSVRIPPATGVNFTGWVDQYKTVTKGSTNFECGCGHKIVVQYRKEFKKSSPYEFVITHRNRERKYVAKNPNEVEVFDRMVKVATYAYCTFAGRVAF